MYFTIKILFNIPSPPFKNVVDDKIATITSDSHLEVEKVTISKTAPTKDYNNLRRVNCWVCISQSADSITNVLMLCRMVTTGRWPDSEKPSNNYSLRLFLLMPCNCIIVIGRQTTDL